MHLSFALCRVTGTSVGVWFYWTL